MSNSFPEKEPLYLTELKEFYSAHFSTQDDLNDFIDRSSRYDTENRTPWRMILQVQRFVELATEIDKIRPWRAGLRILFLKCCMESLAKLSKLDSKAFSASFSSSFSEKGKEYILNNFSLFSIESPECEIDSEEIGELTINDILWIIKATRDIVVHEGNYWEFQFFASDEESTLLTHIETDEQVLSRETYAPHNKQKLTYCFGTKLLYDKFIYYFVEACIIFINNYIDRIKNE